MPIDLGASFSTASREAVGWFCNTPAIRGSFDATGGAAVTGRAPPSCARSMIFPRFLISNLASCALDMAARRLLGEPGEPSAAVPNNCHSDFRTAFGIFREFALRFGLGRTVPGPGP